MSCRLNVMDKHSASVALLYPKLGCCVQVFRVDATTQEVFFSSYLIYLVQSMPEILCAVGKTVLSRD